MVNKHHGSYNGCTEAFSTNYYFKIADEGLETLIDVVADALINPIFDKENIKKEINNVNSEISFRIKYNKTFSDYKLLK